jgi:hypothetical protein
MHQGDSKCVAITAAVVLRDDVQAGMQLIVYSDDVDIIVVALKRPVTLQVMDVLVTNA